MLILNTPTDIVTLSLAGASTLPLPCVVSFRDIDATNYTPGRVAINSNGATPVDIVPSPASGVQRVVDFISAYNPNTAPATVVIRISIGGTPFTLTQVILAQGERLEYQDGEGWRTFTTAGALKTSQNQGTNSFSSGNQRVVLGANVINNNATLNTIQTVTGLGFPVTATMLYTFTFSIMYLAAATTTGSRWSITGPANNLLIYSSSYSLTATSQTLGEGLTAYDLPAASNASSASTLGNIATVSGFVRPTVAGTVEARFASEVANSAITALAGSFVDFAVVI